MNCIRIALLVLVAGSTQVFAQDDYVSPTGHDYGKQNRLALRDGLKAAATNDFERFLATAGERYIQHSPDLADGWKPVWDLVANRPKTFSTKSMKWVGPAGFADNGNYMVMFREVNRGDGTAPSKVVDIMLFDENAKYIEHWDIRQAISDKTASGRSETEAAKQFLDSPVTYSAEVEEKNKTTVASFLQMAFNDGKLNEALDTYVAKDYVQHNPLIPDGSEPVKEIFASGKLPPLKYDIQLMIAQNDIVIVYSKVEVTGNEMAVVDILRVRDGILVEHWDVLQQVPAPIEMPHTNGMFNIPALTQTSDSK